MLDLILTTGAIGPAIIGAAYLLWLLGLRDPFLLTVSSVVIGGAVGWGVNVGISKRIDGRRKPSPRKPRVKRRVMS
ncbi:MAG TPA: hypothetical protein VF432_04755 [Thermoanaerobaculia bacterium]